MDMFMILMFSVLVLALLLLMLGKFFSKKTDFDREYQSPFECGFFTLKEFRMSFSLHFFLVALVFVIFDMEIIILFPFIIEVHSMVSSLMTFVYIIFIFILTVGLINEWNQMVLEWSK